MAVLQTEPSLTDGLTCHHVAALRSTCQLQTRGRLADPRFKWYLTGSDNSFKSLGFQPWLIMNSMFSVIKSDFKLNIYMCIFLLLLFSLKVQSFPLPRRLTSSVSKKLANAAEKWKHQWWKQEMVITKLVYLCLSGFAWWQEYRSRRRQSMGTVNSAWFACPVFPRGGHRELFKSCQSFITREFAVKRIFNHSVVHIQGVISFKWSFFPALASGS